MGPSDCFHTGISVVFIVLVQRCQADKLSPQLCDYRAEFSQWWVKEMKAVKLPAQGTVFDYFLDPVTRRFLPWSHRVPVFHTEPHTPLQVTPPLPHTQLLCFIEKAPLPNTQLLCLTPKKVKK